MLRKSDDVHAVAHAVRLGLHPNNLDIYNEITDLIKRCEARVHETQRIIQNRHLRWHEADLKRLQLEVMWAQDAPLL